MDKIIACLICALASAAVNATPIYSMQEIPIIAAALNNNGLIVGRLTNSASDAGIWNSNTGETINLTSLPAFSSGYAFDVNDNNQVIGQIFTNHGNDIKAFVWEDGKTTILKDLPSDNFSRPNDINNLGQILGISGSPRILTLWDESNNPVEITDKHTITNTFINDSGQIAWTRSVDPDVWELGSHAFIKSNGTDIDLGTLGGMDSWAYGLNNNGWVVGISDTSLSEAGRAFVWDGNSMEALAKIEGFGGGWTQASAINDNNVIVGSQDSPESDLNHAILWNGWKAHDLKDLLADNLKQDGWIITDALDINDLGQIISYAFNEQTQQGGYYLLTPDTQLLPIPEPSTYTMLLAGLGLLMFSIRKTNRLSFSIKGIGM